MYTNSTKWHSQIPEDNRVEAEALIGNLSITAIGTFEWVKGEPEVGISDGHELTSFEITEAWLDEETVPHTDFKSLAIKHQSEIESALNKAYKA
jgi:hypothetical protein